MEEKRISFRIRRPLLLRLVDLSGAQHTFNITDINEGGVRFLSPVPFTEGESVSLQLKLPTHLPEWHEFEAKVLESKDITKYPGAFVSGFRTRLKFESVPSQTAVFLKEYCSFAIKQIQALERTYKSQLGILDKEAEKRGNVRINKSLVAMYSKLDDSTLAEWDITAIRNISTGGALFTAKSLYKNFTHLQLLIKIPSRPFDWLDLNAKVIEAKKLTNTDDLLVGGTFLTRVEFFSVPLEKREPLEEYIEWHINQIKKTANPGLL